MRRISLTREEMGALLRDALSDLDGGMSVDEIERRHGLRVRRGRSSTQRSEGLDVAALQRENARLKRLVADMALLIDSLRSEGPRES